MRINELERQTGLDRATIRYYEKEALITPTRQENGYRDYSDDDKEQLLKIKLLRQLGMSLEQIRNIQQGREDFQSALSGQLKMLTNLRSTVDRSMEVCRMMQSDSVTYQTMDASHYIRELSKPSSLPSAPAAPKITYEFSEHILRQWHPGRRFFARHLDLILLSALLLFVQVTIFRKGLNATIFNPFSILMMLFLIPVEAVCYRFFGATPGKWALGITVDSSEGCRHTMRTAFSRAWRVYRYGMGFGIPIWILYRQFKCYTGCCDGFEMSWDDESELTFKPMDWKRCAAAVLLILVSISLYCSSISIAKQPIYTETDMNLEQFVEVYNYYWELRTNDGDLGLKDDGTFHRENGIVIYANGDLSYEDFSYEMDGECITGIRYTEEWNDLFMVDCKPSRGYVAAAAMLSFGAGEDYESVHQLYETLNSLVDKALSENQNAFTYEESGIIITWTIQYENASYNPTLGLVHSQSDYAEDQPGYAKIEMSVQVTAAE